MGKYVKSFILCFYPKGKKSLIRKFIQPLQNKEANNMKIYLPEILESDRYIKCDINAVVAYC